jgi:hypothetical protein
MRFWIGLTLLICGIAAGLYAGLWWAFVGGIVSVIEGIKADPVNSWDIAIGLCRFFFAAPIGWVTGIVCVLPGLAMMNE